CPSTQTSHATTTALPNCLYIVCLHLQAVCRARLRGLEASVPYHCRAPPTMAAYWWAGAGGGRMPWGQRLLSMVTLPQPRSASSAPGVGLACNAGSAKQELPDKGNKAI
uniref:Uncharacterized protein n=1 Tax=Pelusios castaneus TaxID=367368 RepID=A0A8C8R6V3_9SAUR